jgi:protein-disulfide isomerase
VDPVAVWSGGSLSCAELEARAGAQLLRAEADYQRRRYDILQGQVRAQVQQALLESEARARGFASVEALAADTSERVQVSEAEVDAFFEETAGEYEPGEAPPSREEVRAWIHSLKATEAWKAYVDGLWERNAARVLLREPEPMRVKVSADDDAVRGNPRAQVTIIEFSDFQCPFCGKVVPTLKDLLSSYEGRVRWVYRDFPLGFHPRATAAAVAAECAGQQGRFWAMHDLLMENQRTLEDADLSAMAARLGVDMGRWTACLADPRVHEEIQHDIAEGTAAGVTGTPTFFVNGAILSGAQPRERFVEAIERELAGGR